MKAFLMLVLLAAWLPGNVQAAGEVPAFKDTVIAKFNEQDLKIMLATVDKALVAPQDGQALDWRNAKTGASGTVTPMNRLTLDGLDCRRARIVNRFGSQTGEAIYRFCEKPKGQWKLLGPES
jgi:surface antigen